MLAIKAGKEMSSHTQAGTRQLVLVKMRPWGFGLLTAAFPHAFSATVAHTHCHCDSGIEK